MFTPNQFKTGLIALFSQVCLTNLKAQQATLSPSESRKPPEISAVNLSSPETSLAQASCIKVLSDLAEEVNEIQLQLLVNTESLAEQELLITERDKKVEAGFKELLSILNPPLSPTDPIHSLSDFEKYALFLSRELFKVGIIFLPFESKTPEGLRLFSLGSARLTGQSATPPADLTAIPGLILPQEQSNVYQASNSSDSFVIVTNRANKTKQIKKQLYFFRIPVAGFGPVVLVDQLKVRSEKYSNWLELPFQHVLKAACISSVIEIELHKQIKAAASFNFYGKDFNRQQTFAAIADLYLLKQTGEAGLENHLKNLVVDESISGSYNLLSKELVRRASQSFLKDQQTPFSSLSIILQSELGTSSNDRAIEAIKNIEKNAREVGDIEAIIKLFDHCREDPSFKFDANRRKEFRSLLRSVFGNLMDCGDEMLANVRARRANSGG